MKQNIVVVLFLVLCGLLTTQSLWAREGGGYGGGHYEGGHYGGGHHGGGWGYGGSYGGGWGYGGGYYADLWGYGYPYRYPAYYPPTVVTVPVTPPVYIQQAPPVVQQNATGYWYYCTQPEGYYPYVKECPNGWQRVAPIPSSSPSPR
jgi:hypothetical protein